MIFTYLQFRFAAMYSALDPAEPQAPARNPNTKGCYVFRTLEEAAEFAATEEKWREDDLKRALRPDEQNHVFGLLADWNRDTRPANLRDWPQVNELIRAATFIDVSGIFSQQNQTLQNE